MERNWSELELENQRDRLSGLKSELLSEFHCNNKCLLLVLLIVFLATSSLEFPAERFLVTYARETLINEWHIPWLTLINEWYIPWAIPDKQMVHPLGYP
jgi:hypothetical protein